MADMYTAGDVMATDVITLSPDTHVIQGIAELLRHNVTGAPVVTGDMTYLGVFSEKCCMRVLAATAKAAGGNRHIETALPTADQFMKKKLVTLTPESDVFDAIGYLLKHRISGAPVVDGQRRFLGVFSEKTAMSVVLASAYDQMPTALVGDFMDVDPNRLTTPDAGLSDIAEKFLKTPYRRLPVLSEGRLIGQISRRDVLRAEHHLANHLRDCDTVLLNISADDDTDAIAAVAHLPATDVGSFMDRDAKTITEDIDLLAIAQIFLNTPFRRLAVLRAGRLVGQVARKDLLAAALHLLDYRGKKESSLIYLSNTIPLRESPFG